MTQNTFMEQAIINAYKGLDLGEVPVGCVIVNHDNKIIWKEDKNPFLEPV